MSDDFVNRKTAIKKIYTEIIKRRLLDGVNDGLLYEFDTEAILKALQSVQPEPLTDKEQRIFLAAMEREEKVCKQVDDECRDCREPYEDSLVRTCHEITRKVKSALWT